jgi:hypothetical protein
MYGFLRGLLPVLRAAQDRSRPWVYADRGYFRASYGNDYSGYFRLTRDRVQHDGSGDGDSDRWKRLELEIFPWRKGRTILVCPPGDIFTKAIGGFSASDWLTETLQKLRRSTDRPIVVRQKPAPGSGARPLVEDLKDAHALVTYMSNTAVEALLFGVPVFVTGDSIATSMGKRDLAEIESPYYPEDRERWARVVAANQWTLSDLRQGKANGLFK